MTLTHQSNMVVFDSVPCPSGEACMVDDCLFSHRLHPKRSRTQLDTAPAGIEPLMPQVADPAHHEAAPYTKRRKLDNNLSTPVAKETKHPSRSAPDSPVETRPAKTVNTLHKPISPPTKKASPSTKKSEQVQRSATQSTRKRAPLETGNRPKEALHPRKVDNDPAPWARRKFYLDILHVEMKRCNKLVQESSLVNKGILLLSEDELIKACLDEEEPIASKNTAVYDSVMKQQIMKFKKMILDVWVDYVKTTFDLPPPPAAVTTPSPATKSSSVTNGLPMSAEHLLLHELRVNDQTLLAKYGYVASPPTVGEIRDAETTKSLTPDWETCERCKTRFQCFQERRPDGVLTTHGPCMFHWGNKLYSGQSRANEKAHGPRDSTYRCCDEPLDSPGCTRSDTHVFKVTDAARLASTLQFITTPENPSPLKSKSGQKVNALTFDCEMGYTSYGFEMIRLTAVSWPDNEQLVDVLVRPQGVILDLNTRFSGVTMDAFNCAFPFGQNANSSDLATAMTIVPSPAAARDLLCSFLTPSTPIIGHALENDLNVVRLCHGVIIDTVMVYPHPRGLPYRLSLKHLSERYLKRDIQTGGANGHDSKEDAIATGDLIRYAVARQWRKKKTQGWTVKAGQLVPPTLSGKGRV